MADGSSRHPGKPQPDSGESLAADWSIADPVVRHLQFDPAAAASRSPIEMVGEERAEAVEAGVHGDCGGVSLGDSAHRLDRQRPTADAGPPEANAGFAEDAGHRVGTGVPAVIEDPHREAQPAAGPEQHPDLNVGTGPGRRVALLGANPE